MEIKKDFTILIGENGGGKTTLLSEVADKYVRLGRNVIAISNTIHDKYDDELLKRNNFSFMGNRYGSDVTHKSFEFFFK
ncbi:hypothetical protein [Marinomonas communis]|uniref:hypothetical protein n=1 Tax=Marinomonas communis TaxID=28254 RepID=UPI00105C602B|nr:hypothetical protein [Marinomonas communis]